MLSPALSFGCLPQPGPRVSALAMSKPYASAPPPGPIGAYINTPTDPIGSEQGPVEQSGVQWREVEQMRTDSGAKEGGAACFSAPTLRSSTRKAGSSFRRSSETNSRTAW